MDRRGDGFRLIAFDDIAVVVLQVVLIGITVEVLLWGLDLTLICAPG